MSRETRPNFNPDSGAIRGVTTLYEFHHEHCHREQMERRTLLWRAREAFVKNPILRWSGLGLIAVCAVELEALLMVRKKLKARNIWTDEIQQEAADAFGSHVDRMLTKFF